MCRMTRKMRIRQVALEREEWRRATGGAVGAVAQRQKK